LERLGRFVELLAEEDDAVAARALPHFAVALQLVEELRRQAHAASRAYARPRLDYGGAAAHAEDLLVLAAQAAIDAVRQLLAPSLGFVDALAELGRFRARRGDLRRRLLL